MLKKWISVLAIGTVIFSSTTMGVLAASRHEQVVLGDKDKWVTEIQESLIDKNLLDENATGYFGLKTQAGIIKFQQENGLDVDGIAGPETRKALLKNKYKDIPETRDVDSKRQNTATQSGDKGDNVLQIQQLLYKLEYLKTKPTGYYGPLTEEAVTKFQRAMGLEQDGICGDITYAMLGSDMARCYVMEKEDEGEDIKALQRRLKKLGYFSNKDTGYFGDITEDAVKEFQRDNELAADGKAGKDTRAKLYSGNVKEDSSNSENKSEVKKSDSKKSETKKSETKKSDSKKSKSNDSDSSEDSASSDVSSFISIAKKQLGDRYILGATGPNSFDCSGFVYYCLRNSGVSTSRLTASSFSSVSKWDKVTSVSNLKKGDLVFFRSPSSSRISHAGIYLGGGKLIHASSSKRKVVISDFSGYYKRNFVNGRRVF